LKNTNEGGSDVRVTVSIVLLASPPPRMFIAARQKDVPGVPS